MRSLFSEMRRRGERPPWDLYGDALARYLERAPEDPRLPPVYFELGRVLSDELGQVNGAIETLRAGVSRFPRDVGLRTELAARLRASVRHAEAAEELRKLVELEPLSVEVWQNLSEALNALGRTDLGTNASEILVALGGGTDFERSAAATRVVRSPQLEPGALDAETRGLLDAGSPEDATTTRLLACAAPGLEKVYPPDFEAYGLTRGDRISPRAGHPTRALVDRIARIFGVENVDVYVHRAHSGGIEVEFADPIALMIPAHVTTLSEGQQTFLIARVMANVARGLHAIDKLAPSAVAEVLVGAMRAVDPNFGAGQGNAEYLETLAKNLFRACRDAPGDPSKKPPLAYGPAPRPRFDEWLLRVRKTSTRAGLIVSGDPASAIDIIRRTEGDLAGVTGPALERGTAILSDALRFLVSDVATAVRRRIGQ